MMSFMTLGIFWIGQQTQLNHLARSDRSLSWIHIVFLFTVSITPFSTTLLAEFPKYRTSRLLVNILLSGSTRHFSWRCALGTGQANMTCHPRSRSRLSAGLWLPNPSMRSAPCSASLALTGASHLLSWCNLAS